MGRAMLAYHVAVYSLFTMLYYLADINKNFNVPSKNDTSDFAFAAYFALVTHSTAGYGDTYPLSWYARVLVMCHLMLVVVPGFLA